MRQTQSLISVLLCLVSWPVWGDTDIMPFAGMRFGGNVNLVVNGTSAQDGAAVSQPEGQVRFADRPAYGLVIDHDLNEPGKQWELYYSRQQTHVHTANASALGAVDGFDVTVQALGFGGLYFPGGRPEGGFVSGTLGATQLDPQDSRLDSQYYLSLVLGGGYKLPLTSSLSLRFDVRGLYTVLDSSASLFCAGGCEAKVDSQGFLQVETSAGLAWRF